MGFVNIDNILTEITLHEITKTEGFYPEKMNADTALQIIKRLKTTLSDQFFID